MGLLIQLTDIKSYLQIAFTTDDALLTQIITNVSAAIESYCRHSFSSVNSYSDVLDGGSRALAAVNRPIAAVAALLDLSLRQANELVGTGNGVQTGFSHACAVAPLVAGTVQVAAGAVVATDDGNGNLTGAGVAAGSTINYTTGAMVLNLSAAAPSGTSITCAYTPATAIVPATLYAVDAARGLLFPLAQPPAGQPIPAGMFDVFANVAFFGVGRRRWQINYTAGYSAVPADIQLAALIMSATRYNRRDALAQEEVGDYRYSVESGPTSGFSAEVEQLLAAYREVII